MRNLNQYKINVPEGQSGKWKISKFTVSEENSKLDRIRAIFHYSGRYCPPGNYTRLSCNGSVVMSDTPDEIRDHFELFREARGHVLLNGLGLGVALQGVLLEPEVDFVTIIEISQDVINLVKTHYELLFPGKFEIIQANALEYKPTTRFNVVWHDIWPTICADNLKEMKMLHRKYGRKTDWQGSWCRSECEYYCRRGY